MNILVVGDNCLEQSFTEAGVKYGHNIWFTEPFPDLADFAQFEPECAVLMISRPAAFVQDYMTELHRECGVHRFLLFERRSDGTCFYVKSEEEDSGLEDFFCRALGENPLYLLKYPEESWKLRFPHAFEGQQRREITKTMLYGITEKEFRRSKERYGLDIDSDNFYLFMWELDKTSLIDYAANTSIHYFLHALRLEDFKQVLKENMGGEIIFTDISFAYIIANGSEPASLRMRKLEAERISAALAGVAGRVSSHCFISRLLHGPEEIYSGHQEFKKTCAYRFFCREATALSEEYVRTHRKWFGREEIQESLDKIRHYISFDMENVELEEEIRHLYMRVVKPSMSYTLYYFVSESILESLKKELQVKILLETMDSPWLILTSQLGTIEESCSQVLECIGTLAKQQVKTHNIGNIVVRQALQYIEENYTQLLSVNEMAKELNVSSSYLSQCFKKETGTGIKRYLTMRRMQEAKKLLMNTDVSVNAVAIAVGYDDYRQFSKMFKAFTGVTPVQCRKGVV